MKKDKTLKLLIRDLTKLGYHIQHYPLVGSAGKSRLALNRGSDDRPFGYYYDLPEHLTGNSHVVGQFLMLMYFKVLQDTANGIESIGQLEPIIVSDANDG